MGRWATESLNLVLSKIEADILLVLAAAKAPMSQSELHQAKKIDGYSEDGWSYALDRLEKKHLVEFVDPQYWQLKDPERRMYIETIQQFLNTPVREDDFIIKRCWFCNSLVHHSPEICSPEKCPYCKKPVKQNN